MIPSISHIRDLLILSSSESCFPQLHVFVEIDAIHSKNACCSTAIFFLLLLPPLFLVYNLSLWLLLLTVNWYSLWKLVEASQRITDANYFCLRHPWEQGQYLVFCTSARNSLWFIHLLRGWGRKGRGRDVQIGCFDRLICCLFFFYSDLP